MNSDFLARRCRSARVIPVIGALLLGGCGGPEYETIPVYSTSGALFINGVPACGAEVRLHPQEVQQGVEYALLPSGKVDKAGGFELTTYEGADGAPPGAYKVTIEWPDPNWRPKGGGPPPPPPDRLKGAFADPEKADRVVTITEGQNVLEPIRLENVEILEGSSLN